MYMYDGLGPIIWVVPDYMGGPVYMGWARCMYVGLDPFLFVM